MSDKYAVLASYAQQMADTGRHVAPFTCQEIIDLLAEREADKARIAELTYALNAANERYENRAPTEWAYDQACAAIEKHRARADFAEQRIAELESRKVIVKWPDDGMDDCYDIWGPEHCRNNFDCGYNFSSVRHEEAIREACAAAGITLETGE